MLLENAGGFFEKAWGNVGESVAVERKLLGSENILGRSSCARAYSFVSLH